MSGLNRHRAHTHLMVELLERLRRPRGNIVNARAQRLLLHWWRLPLMRCAVCWEGRWLRKLGACVGCGRVYFMRDRPQAKGRGDY